MSMHTTPFDLAQAANFKPAFTPDYRPNKQELQARLYHAFIRAGTYESEQDLPTTQAADPSTQAAAATFEPYASRSSYNVDKEAMMDPEWAAGEQVQLKVVDPPSPRMLPTPPFSPSTTLAYAPAIAMSPSMPTFDADFDADPARPQLHARRSRLPPHLRPGSGECRDPILTPSHTWSGTFRRTPGAPLKAVAEPDARFGGSYFQLPPDADVVRVAEPHVFYASRHAW